jgi:hypothetical protein
MYTILHYTYAILVWRRWAVVTEIESGNLRGLHKIVERNKHLCGTNQCILPRYASRRALGRTIHRKHAYAKLAYLAYEYSRFWYPRRPALACSKAMKRLAKKYYTPKKRNVNTTVQSFHEARRLVRNQQTTGQEFFTPDEWKVMSQADPTKTQFYANGVSVCWLAIVWRFRLYWILLYFTIVVYANRMDRYSI